MDYMDPTSLSRFARTFRGFHQCARQKLRQTARTYALPSQDVYDKYLTKEQDGRYYAYIFGDQEIPPREPMVQAIIDGRLDALKGFLDAGVSPDSYTISGHRMLSVAIVHDQVDCANLLLQYQANPRLPDLTGNIDVECRVPFYHAAASCRMGGEFIYSLIEIGVKITSMNVFHLIRNRPDALDILAYAVEYGTDLGSLTGQDGSTILHNAIYDWMEFYPFVQEDGRQVSRPLVGDPRLIEYIVINYPELIDEQNLIGQTALHRALCYSKNNPGIAEQLIELECAVGISDEWGRQELHYAVQQLQCNAEIVRALCRRSEVDVNAIADIIPYGRVEPLRMAVYDGNYEMANVLLEDPRVAIHQDCLEFVKSFANGDLWIQGEQTCFEISRHARFNKFRFFIQASRTFPAFGRNELKWDHDDVTQSNGPDSISMDERDTRYHDGH
ncbi:ankyrin repeat domain-containing protein [Aspergillus affinis]|uniref:ankyrin repeat domain-containing protein n=1 Tax=Aspergillus affinis TaxID=1070780 RepID=UPI0022FE9CBB|nr:ankyrin [Aspergillus affinis]KAI9040962.1 ankyrin [Aspergillus affinis]